MEYLTIILIIATLLCGAASFLVRKPSTSAYVLSVVLSICSIAMTFEDASITDDQLMICLMPVVAICFISLGRLIVKYSEEV